MMQALIGFLTGVVASMGLGGGFILMIWLTIFAEVDQRAAQGINLLFFLPIALFSLVIHIKNGFIDKVVVKKYIAGGALGAVLGTLASGLIAGELLNKLFALFMLAFGLRELFSSDKKD